MDITEKRKLTNDLISGIENVRSRIVEYQKRLTKNQRLSYELDYQMENLESERNALDVAMWR